MIAMVCYVNVATFVHTHSGWVPDLAVSFASRAKLVQKVTTIVKNLTETLVSLVSNLGDTYLSNRPQVSMVYKLINPAGCW